MIEVETEIATDLVLRVDEDGPCWRWAWLDDDLKVVSEGVGLTQAGAGNAAATVLEALVMLTARTGVAPATRRPLDCSHSGATVG